MNASVAIARGLAASWLAWLILQEVFEQIKGPPASVTDYRLPPVPTTAVEAPAGFVYAARWQRRLKFLLFGLALMSAAVPAISSFGDLPPHQTASNASLSADLHKSVLGGLITCTLIGMASFWIGVASRPTYIFADAEGIHEQERDDVKSLPWDSILAITVHASDGEAISVEVIGEADSVKWPGSWTRLLLPREDMQTASPEQLAALVVERSGRQPRIVQND